MGCHASKLRMEAPTSDEVSVATGPASSSVARVTPSSSSTSPAVLPGAVDSVAGAAPRQQAEREKALAISLGKAVTQDILTSKRATKHAAALSDDIMPHYLKAAQRAVDFLSKRVLSEQWVSEHDDFGYYYKAPLAFLELGREADARKALAVAVRFLTGESAGVPKGSPCDQLYPQYPLLWLAWAAERLGVGPLADKCYDIIATFAHPVTGTGLTGAPYSKGKPFESSFFATAVLAKSALLHGKVSVAIDAGESLLRAIQANEGEMAQGRFCLRWTWSGGLAQEAGAYYQVSKAKGSGQQAHWMLAFPASVLLELSDVVRADLGAPLKFSQATAKDMSSKFGAAAETLMEFLRACGNLDSNGHMVACAAAQAKDKELATKLVDSLLLEQVPSGAFQHDPEALDTVDQAAEIACCIQQVRRAMAARNSSCPATSPVCPKQPEIPSDRRKQAGLIPRPRAGGTVACTGVPPASVVQAPSETIGRCKPNADDCSNAGLDCDLGLRPPIGAPQRGVGSAILGAEEMDVIIGANGMGDGGPVVMPAGPRPANTVHTYEAGPSFIGPAQRGHPRHAGWWLGPCCTPAVEETTL